MGKLALVIILCIGIIEVCFSQSNYTAAVVEYYPVQDRNLTPQQVLLENARNYKKILQKIEQKLDIIVYPESTLYSIIPSRQRSDLIPIAVEVDLETPTRCLDEQSSYFDVLACSARDFHTYLVVNLIEKELCESCLDGWNLYNTNVVFDRNGGVIAKYRKYNLYGEVMKFLLNRTATADITIFKTDFGITFGTFTCFDIQFGTPALELVRTHGMKHIIFTVRWFSELPFLTALQAQQQFAQELDIVLLSAGANDPAVGSGGTGIYQGQSGVNVIDFVELGGSNSYVHTVPGQSAFDYMDEKTIDESALKLDGFFLKRDDLSEYQSKPLTEGHVTDTVCSDDAARNTLCCHFDVITDWNPERLADRKKHYNYKMVAYTGTRSFTGIYNGGVEICGIVACLNDDINSCNYRFGNYSEISWPVTFKHIEIKANFTVDENRIQFPNSLLSSIRPLPARATNWEKNYFDEGAVVERKHELLEPQTRLMTFAIYGRDFSRDSDPFA